jgi:probable HAF family extracellular repeat protein
LIFRLLHLEGNMKTFVTSLAAGSLLTTLAVAQSARYTVIDLGTLKGGTFSQAAYINNLGLITGVAATTDGTQHAVAWAGGQIIDLVRNGLGGPNSVALGVNVWGQAVGQAEGSSMDPNHENFCGYGTGLVCLPFLWQGGRMTPLALPGGNNGAAGPINIRGEATGIAETASHDPDCTLGKAANGTGPQTLNYKAVIWEPGAGQPRILSSLAGDTVSMGFWINDNGQVAGASGTCANTILPPFAGGRRAVLWERDGSAHDLGNLGGTGNPALLGIVNIAFVVNNAGQVTGASVLPGNTKINAFLWTRENGMKSLGTLVAHVNSAGLGMNDRGHVVGASIDGTLEEGLPSAFLWRNGMMADLNAFLTPESPFDHLLVASAINDAEMIVGFGLTKTGDVHGFLAIPGGEGSEDFAAPKQNLTRSVALPEHVRKSLWGGR